MNPTLHLRLALLLPWVAAHALPQQAVSLQRQDQTTIAVMAYAPMAGACRSVAVISPGAGGSETGYSYLGEALAGLDYLAVVVERQVAGRD